MQEVLIPPVLPDLASQLEKYLLHPELLPIHDTGYNQQFVFRRPNPINLLQPQSAPINTDLQVTRNPCTGEVEGFHEVGLRDAGTTAKNSTSLARAPGPLEEATRGSSTNYPFWPGGFDPPPSTPASAPGANAGTELTDFSPTAFLTCPPGFDHGVDFLSLTPSVKTGGSTANASADSQPGDNAAVRETEGTASVSGEVNLANLLADMDSSLVKSLFGDAKEDQEESRGQKRQAGQLELEGLDSLVSGVEVNLKPTGQPSSNFNGGTGHVIVTNKTSVKKTKRMTEWAEMLDSEAPMDDFYQKVPQMAFQWPFELDTFQKQAVLRLEEGQSVFVAAHTSAGKTVVAEYAIALSQKHMTRTIYTSPIKALSNQKFRDFKETFNDVGLVTGDIQINPAATCLIMTTEILRSMLYNGSDIIRDLEWVIFDEVHYINDPERGVVWEEVLILLPEHVNIIMLSATVPNTLEFADWVGRTKKRKIWVISTAKRPVPLEHFLYTGSSGKTRDERFLLQDANGNFLSGGHAKAVQAKKERESKGKQQTGNKGVKDRVGPQQEKGIWLTLIDHLQRRDKLPVVAFTLSRNRCDQTASMLTSLDLTTAVEKSDIHHFITKCISRLKGSDRKLPQVMQLSELLKRGIGIHHSGILPILKEVVECCFANGWVKLLFATETFAMGVNMPARTVVFDSIRKHDGKEFRTLLPAEYIQMAGRAGRRGLDSTGTVIVMCKNEVFDISELHGMMQGQPTRLESKFRLTYSMILNLLRVEELRVEDMMKRSFGELDTQKKQLTYRERAVELKKRLEDMPDVSGPQYEDMSKLFSMVSSYLDIKEKIWQLVLNHQVPTKALVPGRLIIINDAPRFNVPVIILAVDNKGKQRSFSVLALQGGGLQDAMAGLSIQGSQETLDEKKLAKFLSIARSDLISVPDVTNTNHQVLTIHDEDIVTLTSTNVKIEADKIMNDVKKREIPRFRNDPPASSVVNAVQQLIKLNDAASQGSPAEHLAYMDPSKEFRIMDIDLQTTFKSLNALKAKINSEECRLSPDFFQQFTKVFSVKAVQEEVARYEYLCSEASLSLLPEYHCRTEVLRRFQYIDNSGTVQLKGRVACEMGSNELIITELVFNNQLTERPPEEIAALLSSMVFQQKKCSPPELTESLKQGIEDIKACAERVGEVQVDCGLLQPVGDYVESFNFGLVEVVYEWARGMPFSDITNLTDVQEGVIVRTIQRLDECLRDVKDAARVIGDPVLYQKMDKASSIIKRDIVFAASLYTQ